MGKYGKNSFFTEARGKSGVGKSGSPGVGKLGSSSSRFRCLDV